MSDGGAWPEGRAEIVLGSAAEPYREIDPPGDFLVDLRQDRESGAEQYSADRDWTLKALNGRRFVGPEPMLRVRNLLQAGGTAFLNGAPLDAMFPGAEGSFQDRAHRKQLTRLDPLPPRRGAQHLTEPGLFVFERHHLANYFHWLNEGLPRLMDVLEHGARLGIGRLVVNARDKAAFAFKMDSLRTHFPLLAERVVPIRPGRFWLDDGFAYPTAALSLYYPRWAPEAEGFGVRGSRLHSAFLRFVDYVDQNTALGAGGPVVPRFVISRADGAGRNLTGEAALMAALEPLGFKRVVLTDFSHAEQIALFRNAEVIVGPNGAGFANLTFARPGTRVFGLTTRQFVHQAFTFTDMAWLRGVDYRMIVADLAARDTADAGRQGHDIAVTPELIEYLRDAV